MGVLIMLPISEENQRRLGVDNENEEEISSDEEEEPELEEPESPDAWLDGTQEQEPQAESSQPDVREGEEEIDDQTYYEYIKELEYEYRTNTSFLTLNCRSLGTTKHQLQQILAKISKIEKPTAIALQETWMSQEDMEKTKLQGYR